MNSLHQADPTKFSYTEAPSYLYEREENDENEVFFTLICSGILNVCQLIRDTDGKIYGVPMSPEYIEEQLTLQEILADMALIELISGNHGDRNIIPGYDYRNKHNEYITGNNCRIFLSGRYSVFDVDCIDFRALGTPDIAPLLLDSVISFYGSPEMSPLSLIRSDDLLGEEFGNRIAKKSGELLARYDSDEGERFFLRQKSHAHAPLSAASSEIKRKAKEAPDFWYDEDRKDYDAFILTLRNTYSLFSHDPLMLDKYAYSRGVLWKETKKYFSLLVENILRLCSLKTNLD